MIDVYFETVVSPIVTPILPRTMHTKANIFLKANFGQFLVSMVRPFTLVPLPQIASVVYLCSMVDVEMTSVTLKILRSYFNHRL